MDIACANDFRDLVVTIPCCGVPISLNDLNYDLPAGFARFILQFESQWKWEVEEKFDTLERILGCKLRMFWARY